MEIIFCIEHLVCIQSPVDSLFTTIACIIQFSPTSNLTLLKAIYLKELEFDLYDYENKKIVGDSSDNTANSIEENFSMSELAPRKLFDSKDTIVNIADEILNKT